MLERDGYELRKWASNEPSVLQDLSPESRAANLPSEIKLLLSMFHDHHELIFSFRLNVFIYLTLAQQD